MKNLGNWFNWVERLQTIAQAGLTYSQNVFDIDRYHQIQDIAAEILSQETETSLEKVNDILRLEKGYATPKLDVRGVVINKGKVLLVKEISDGYWTLPGGWVDVGESPSESVAREIREESGYEAFPVKLLALYDHRLHQFPPYFFHIYKLFFLCELKGGNAQSSIETSDAGFFERKDIPPLSQGRITHEVLNRLFSLIESPSSPTDFD